MNHPARAYPRFNAQDLIKHLPDVGDGLSVAMVDLARDPTVTRCDEVVARLQSAGHAIARLRCLLAEGMAP